MSLIATIGFVREAMVALQQQMGRDKGIVMDGRIGSTLICEPPLSLMSQPGRAAKLTAAIVVIAIPFPRVRPCNLLLFL